MSKSQIEASSLKAKSIIEQIFSLSAVELSDIENSIEVRRAQLRTNMRIGSRVRFNNNTGTRYMVGITGTLVAKKTKKWVVQIDPGQNVGRFARGYWDPIAQEYKNMATDITAPAEILDVIG